MGVDYVTSAFWGVEVSVPEEEDDEYGWAEDLTQGTPYRMFTCGSSWSGDVAYAIGLGERVFSRGGSPWNYHKPLSAEEKAAFKRFLRDKNLPGEPAQMSGLHIC